MAIKMKPQDEAALKAAGEAWNRENAAGNQAGMDAAHAEAEAIRAKYGYSGGADGSQIIELPSTTTPTSTTPGGVTSTNPQTTWTPTDNSGNNYAEMSGMSNLHQAALEAAGQKWQDAYAKGDKAGMESAHAEAEAIRALYGYSGGADGSEYKMTGGFNYTAAPTYTDPNSAKIDAMLNQILNRDAFSYNALDDPLYQQYSQQYRREGQRAMQDTLGQVSARTGGMASSYATSAAQQANNNYASQLADKIPELYQLAYSMYLDDIDLKVQDLGLLENASDRQYSRFRDTMNDWRDDRDFAYGLYRDDIADKRYDSEWEYKQIRDQVADSHWQQTYDRGVFESDRDYEYGVGRDDVEDGRYNQDEAQRRVQEHILDMGGSAADLPEDVIKASGYSPAELAAMEKTYADNKAEAANTGTKSGDGGVDPIKGDLNGDGVLSKDEKAKLEEDAATQRFWDSVNNLGIGSQSATFIAEIASFGGIVENADGTVKWANGWNKDNYKEKLKAARQYSLNQVGTSTDTGGSIGIMAPSLDFLSKWLKG